jgi:LacI family transcriptional regulator
MDDLGHLARLVPPDERIRPRSTDREARMYVSLKDVAARAGVSFQTASKVLNGNHRVVSEATRERILAAARELGYLRNALAHGLVTSSTYTIGVIGDDLGDRVLAQFLVGAEQEARRHGHSVLISITDPDRADFEGCVRQLLERRVDGILAAAPHSENDPGIGDLLRGRVPAVSIHHVPGGSVPVVGSDHAETGRLAAEHLLDLGHRQIATIAGPTTRRVTRSRLRGFRAALDEAGIDLPDSRLASAAWTAATGFTAMRVLIEREPGITAVFAQNDDMATGALAALGKLGRRVPDDCAVVGCDDLPQAPFLVPPLTSIHIPFRDTGRAAMALLLERINDAEHADRVLMPVRLIARTSTLGYLPSEPPPRSRRPGAKRQGATDATGRPGPDHQSEH